ncbi:MAG: Bax inhibitor-1/YccA family protein [Spirochaetaceae bacterium]|nr:Bax inhibitor-1/YccA family protein [Spirochaetaceae bacterium]
MSNYNNGDYRNVTFDDGEGVAVFNTIFRGAFLWMFFGLAVTAAVAFYLVATPAGNALMMQIFSLMAGSSLGFILFAVIQIGLVMFLVGAIQRLSTGAAMLMFTLYAASMGFTLSFYTLIYGLHVVYMAFVAASAFFGSAALFGFFTKKDLTGVGRLAFSALLAIIIISVINFFMRSPFIYYIVSYIGVVVFTLLTAYDVQKIKNMARAAGQGTMGVEIDYRKLAIMGALTLYLDFINLLFFMIRILGNRR